MKLSASSLTVPICTAVLSACAPPNGNFAGSMGTLSVSAISPGQSGYVSPGQSDYNSPDPPNLIGAGQPSYAGQGQPSYTGSVQLNIQPGYNGPAPPSYAGQPPPQYHRGPVPPSYGGQPPQPYYRVGPLLPSYAGQTSYYRAGPPAGSHVIVVPQSPNSSINTRPRLGNLRPPPPRGDERGL